MHVTPVPVEDADNSTQPSEHDNFTQNKTPPKDENNEEMSSSVFVEDVNNKESNGLEEVPTQPEENRKI